MWNCITCSYEVMVNHLKVISIRYNWINLILIEVSVLFRIALSERTILVNLQRALLRKQTKVLDIPSIDICAYGDILINWTNVKKQQRTLRSDLLYHTDLYHTDYVCCLFFIYSGKFLQYKCTVLPVLIKLLCKVHWWHIIYKYTFIK